MTCMAATDSKLFFWDPIAGKCLAKCMELKTNQQCVRCEDVYISPLRPYFNVMTGKCEACSSVWDPVKQWCG